LWVVGCGCDRGTGRETYFTAEGGVEGGEDRGVGAVEFGLEVGGGAAIGGIDGVEADRDRAIGEVGPGLPVFGSGQKNRPADVEMEGVAVVAGFVDRNAGTS
jgi:hypothetical protein